MPRIILYFCTNTKTNKQTHIHTHSHMSTHMHTKRRKRGEGGRKVTEKKRGREGRRERENEIEIVCFPIVGRFQYLSFKNGWSTDGKPVMGKKPLMVTLNASTQISLHDVYKKSETKLANSF